jgi:cardiolipin synthase A/B
VDTPCALEARRGGVLPYVGLMRGRASRPRIVATSVLLVAALLSACRPNAAPPTAPTAQPAPTAAPLAATSATPSAAPPAGQLSLLVEPDAGMAPIYALIASARSHIDLTMYELVDTDAELALETAAGRGVVVRVLLDANREKAANQPAYDELVAMGVQVKWADQRYAATHQKTLIVDHTTALVMSLNLTSRYYPNTRDYGVVDRDPSDVAAIEQVFDADFEHAKITPPPGADLVWSPKQSAPALLSLITTARSQLLVENEEMADKQVIAALTNSAHRGVHVVVVMTEQPQWDAAFKTLVAAHVVVRIYAPNARLYIHAKAIVADARTPRQRAFVGSENFSVTSLNGNRELGLLTTDTGVVNGLATAIESDAAGAQSWPTRTR